MSPPDVVIDPPEELRRVDALGEVVESGRGALPFWLVHGEPLVACAAWALGEAGVDLVDVGTPWADLVEDGRPLVLADPLCPLTPPDFVVACVEAAEASGAVIVGIRPAIDTSAVLATGSDDGSVPAQDGVEWARVATDATGGAPALRVASPVVIPAAVVEALDGLPHDDFALLVAVLAERFPVRCLPAPPTARRVTGPSDIGDLEAMTGR